MQTSERVGEKGSAWTPRPTLTGSDYTSIEVWEEERERIWWGDWVCVGRTEEIPEPGDYIVRDVAGVLERIADLLEFTRQLHSKESRKSLVAYGSVA